MLGERAGEPLRERNDDGDGCYLLVGGWREEGGQIDLQSGVRSHAIWIRKARCPRYLLHHAAF